jgi:hypothetical protein
VTAAVTEAGAPTLIDVEPTGPGGATGAAGAAPERIGRYELIRELARGGMGVVYIARDTKLGRRVAIKLVRHAARGVAERFLVEARATARCSHENIVIIHEVGEHEGMPFLVLELLDGRSLREIAAGAGPLPPSRVVELVLPIARALAYAHAAGIVHRDLKPENVVVTAAGLVKVVDFGIATVDPALLDDPARGPAREAARIGTLQYMAPEQIAPGEITRSCDLWALGVIAFELLAGRHPLHPATTERLLESAAADAPLPSLRGACPGVPAALAELVDRCLAKRAADRPADAAEVVRALEALLPHRRRTLGEDERPYPGLAAFQERDADRFFGRSREIAHVIARLRERPLIGVVGPSGAGKSSFARAGVGAALKLSDEPWDVIALRPGRDPLAALSGVAEEVAGDPAALADEPGRFGELLRARARRTGRRLLVLVDQLEELYTLGAAPAVRRAFTAALAGVADDAAAPLRVIVSMRSDFLDRVAEDPRFLDELSRGLVFLSPPDRERLREVLVAPAEQAGYRFESAAMVEDMLDALAGAPGALPLLQFAAGKLWDARDRERRVLTAASYQAIGGISGALAAHADEVIAGMSAPARRLTRRLFRALVTPERTRAIVELADLYQAQAIEDRGELARVLDVLVGARLLVVQTSGEATTGSAELVHESLIERWPTLRAWLDEDADDAAVLAQLSAAAKQWDAKGRLAGLLWRGDALEEARRWDAQRARELGARDRAFLDAGLALARRGRRVRRAALVIAFAALASVAIGATLGLLRVRAAEQETSEAAVRARDEAARAGAALSAMEKKEAERLDAERRRHAAETDRRSALDDARAKTVQVQKSREQLEAANGQLEAALRETRRATERAVEAQTRAEGANELLLQALERERGRIRQLEEEKKKLSTTLKDCAGARRLTASSRPRTSRRSRRRRR